MHNKQTMWSLYLVRYDKGYLYTGITTDIARRFQQHSAGEGLGAKALRGRRALSLVYHCEVGDRSTALKLEYRLKQLSKASKEQLVLAQPNLTELLLRLKLAN